MTRFLAKGALTEARRDERNAVEPSSDSSEVSASVPEDWHLKRSNALRPEAADQAMN